MMFLPFVVSPAPKSSCERKHQALQSFSHLCKHNCAPSEWAPQPPETSSHPYNTNHLSISKELLQKSPRAYSRLTHHPPAAQPFTITQTGWSLSSNQPGIPVLAPVLSGPCQPHQNPGEWLPYLPKWPECCERVPVPPFTPADTSGRGPWSRNAGSWPSSSRVSKTCSMLCSP